MSRAVKQTRPDVGESLPKSENVSYVVGGLGANRKEPSYFLLGTVGELGARVD
jgi:hypothetical protein